MNEEKKSSGMFGCLMIILFFVGITVAIIVLILLAIYWEYPGSSDLGYTLWDYSKIPFLIGAPLAPAGLALYFSEKNKTKDCNIPVIATITEIKEERHANLSGPGTYPTFTPYYTYYLNGQYINVKGRGYSTGQNKYQVGAQVQMYVSMGEPYKYRIDSESKKAYIVGLVFALIGLPLLLLGIGMWVASLLLL